MALGDEVIEVPIGDINGVNVTFYTSVAYQSGTLREWMNGILIRSSDDDGFTETNPATGEFQTKVALLNGDAIVVRYIEA